PKSRPSTKPGPKQASNTQLDHTGPAKTAKVELLTRQVFKVLVGAADVIQVTVGEGTLGELWATPSEEGDGVAQAWNT
ncbi:hypothetical protein ACFY0A_44960, partial [Streptomyces sp. NPDC001698]|uniref:hypothetical protein n=1 Tax=Streptomyces sp. NPDC001698 TaxID=3364601 RepID=UPI00368192A4